MSAAAWYADWPLSLAHLSALDVTPAERLRYLVARTRRFLSRQFLSQGQPT